LRAGVQWWVCRSARAAMWVLARSGVRFRTPTNDDGNPERWQPPMLPAWEVPRRTPHERRPRAPEWEPEAAAQIAELAAASDDAAGGASLHRAPRKQQRQRDALDPGSHCHLYRHDRAMARPIATPNKCR
jgi:hypothetical protein